MRLQRSSSHAATDARDPLFSSRKVAAASVLAALTALSTLGGPGCSQDLADSNPSPGEGEPGEAGVKALDMAAEGITLVDPDGPQLAPLKLSVPVYAKPDERSARIGALRLGAKVARSSEPVSKTGCAGGWYAIHPLGHVCVGESATLDLQHPLVRAIAVEPDRNKPMPYSYAFVRAIAPNYLRVPTKDEQFQYEMRLERHLRNYKRLSDRWDRLEVGANDVPLDERGVAQDRIPEAALPLDMNRRFGGNGDDSVPWWLQGGRKIENVSGFRAPSYAVIADRIKRHAGVSLIGSFVAGEEAGGRRFAIATDGRLIPADKLKADSGSAFHGHMIEQIGLPVAFAVREGARYWAWSGERLSKGDTLTRREMVALTGTVKVLAGERMVETRDGRWLKSEDLKTAAKPSQLPWFAKNNRRWIDISILSQTMVLWEGNTPVYATLVSTGRDGLGDPQKTLSTPQGTFNIAQKLVTGTMDSDVADNEFELRDVPWVMYFKGGYALHGAYWHDDFGRERSHGCVNLAPIDARFVFHWSTPDVPAHWHSASAGDSFGQGTLISIHP